jgi:hypothetical protein
MHLPDPVNSDLSPATTPLPVNGTFMVDDSGDAEDADPNDGVCATNTGVCTLSQCTGQRDRFGGFHL